MKTGVLVVSIWLSQPATSLALVGAPVCSTSVARCYRLDIPSSTCSSTSSRRRPFISFHKSSQNNSNEWTSDFDDFIGDNSNASNDNDDNDDDDSLDMAKLFADSVMAKRSDYSACQTRQFTLGTDLILSNFVGNMGFEEVTDWEYYYPAQDDNDDDDDTQRRQVVQPNPFDKSQPRRTRQKSGSVVRVFRGELVGPLGGLLSAQGMDRRVLIKEFTGTLALQLAQAELASVGKLQSDLLLQSDPDNKNNNENIAAGAWIQTASARSVRARQDNANVASLVQWLRQAPFLGILGGVNLAELDGNVEPNEFYRELGVAPPKPEAVWIVYEYAGLSTIQAYAEPAIVRRAKLPPQRGFFGNVVAPPKLPAWSDRAKYVVKGVMKQATEAVATLHESGIVHRSIGKSSLIISSKTMDKTEAVSPFATAISQLRIKLADFGFSGPYKEASADKEFCTRARSFGLSFRQGENSIATTNFAIAEDMNALGFVFLALLLSSLAELPNPEYQMPATDEDTLQRLFGDIFDKDMEQFREYVEAEDIWSNLVNLLDENDGAGWKVLETLLLAREKAAKNKDTAQIFTVRGLLSNPFFS